LDYNILLGCNYVYAMIVVASSVFRIMMFPHDGKIITVDQLTYYKKKTSNTPNGMLPFVGSSPKLITTYIEHRPGLFKPSTLLVTYPRDLPLLEVSPIRL